MIKRVGAKIHPRYFLAWLPIAIAFLGLGRVFGAQISTDYLLAWVVLSALYTLTTVLAGSLERRIWTGYSYLTIIACYLSVGLELTLMMVVAGSAIAILYKRRFGHFNNYRDYNAAQLLEEYLGRVAINGIGTLVGFIAYIGFGNQLPFQSFDIPQVQLVGILVSDALVFLTMYIVAGFITRSTFKQIFTDMRETAVLDFLTQFAAVVLPVVMHQLGVIPLIIIVSLLGYQAIRMQQMYITRALLEKRANEVSTLNTLGQTVSGNLSLAEVLRLVHEQVNQLVKPTTVFTALYDPKSQIVEYPAVLTNNTPQRWQKRMLGKGLTDWVIRNRKPLLLNMVESANFGMMGINPGEVESQAYVGVPLIVADNLVGVIGVTHYSNSQAFDAMDMNVLQTIANQAGLAIRNASLYNRTINLAQHLALINQSLHEVMFNLDRDSIVHVACNIAAKVTETSKAAIFGVTEHFGLKVLASIGLDDTLPIDTHIIYRPELYRTGTRAVYSVMESDDSDLRELAMRCHFVACLEVPLRSTNTFVGIIAVYHDEPHVYEETEINLLEMLANQMTAAFDNTDLLQALELYASEQAQLVHLSRITASNLELDRVISDVSLVLLQMMNMNHVQIGLFSPQNEVLQLYTANSDNYVSSEEVLISTMPELEIVIENPQLANPYVLYMDDESVSESTLAFMAKTHNQALAIMPMMINKQIFGVIFLGCEDKIDFGDNTRRLLEMATHQVSAQIHNARVHTITANALADQLQQLSLIEDIAQKISQSLELDLIIANVLDAAIRATEAEFAELALEDEQNHWQVMSQTASRKFDPNIQIHVDGLMEAVVESSAMVVSKNGDMSDRHLYEDSDSSALAVPLMIGERVIGVLRIMSRRTTAFTQEHASFIRSLAGHAAISIDNARLLDDHQYQIKTLTELRTLTLEALSTVENQDVLKAVLKTALVILEGTEASLFGYDIRTDEIVALQGAKNNNGLFVISEPTIVSQPLYDAVHKQAIEVVMRGGSADYDSQGNLLYPTVVAIPIKRHGGVREVLAIGYEKTRNISKRDLATLDLLAIQIANHLEQISLNQAIRTSNDRMRAILNSTRDGIILLDNAGRVQDANLTANTMLQANLSERLGESLVRILQNSTLPEEKPLLDAVTQIIQDSNAEQDEIVFARKNETLYYQALLLPVRDERRNIIGRLLSLRDITEEKLVSATRESLQRMVLHDLRSPMSAIITGLSFMQVLLDDLDSTATRDVRRTLDASLESSNNLMRLMDTLRDIPRMKDIAIQAQSTQMSVLTQKAYESLEASFIEAQIQFEVQIDDSEFVYVDVDLIRRVLINLLHNALKFTPEGGRILVATQHHPMDNGYLRVLVCDDGPGIPLDMREKIFNEFQQVTGSLPKRGGRGTGLGLTLCKLAVEAHGGQIWVESQSLLAGACFAFTLPMDEIKA